MRRPRNGKRWSVPGKPIDRLLMKPDERQERRQPKRAGRGGTKSRELHKINNRIRIN